MKRSLTFISLGGFICIIFFLTGCAAYHDKERDSAVAADYASAEPFVSDAFEKDTQTEAGGTGTQGLGTEAAENPETGYQEEYKEESEIAAMTTPISPERIIYQTGFFQEPISEDLKLRINGLSYKDDCSVPYEDLRYINVLYVDFDHQTQVGEIICNKAIAQDLLEIFYELYQAGYQIAQIRLVDEYDADDTLSCLNNNSSCFNFRLVEGTATLSKHALGMAIDINPVYNPYITYPNGTQNISPVGSDEYADRSKDFPHKIDENDLCYQLFIQHGFTWGGHWKSLKDYQHFQKE